MPDDEESRGRSVSEDGHDDDVYGAEGREELTDDEEISPDEEGFMEGYESEGREAVCQTCGKVIVDVAVEKEQEGTLYRFCSERCADAYKDKPEEGF